MNILLVEDDSDIRKIMVKFIKHLGHMVHESENGIDALEVLEEKKVHLIISDIVMPGMGGIDLLKKIKKSKEYKDLVVVLFSGYRDVEQAIEALRAGAYDYLLKPIKFAEFEALLTRIAEYLSIKEENLKLSTKFEQELDFAAKEIKEELLNMRKAYAKAIGNVEIGIFSEKLNKVFSKAKKLHRNPDIPVLIEGETGTGKEIVARYIHYGKGETITPFVGINCAAISPNLFESELFGYEAGAFTGGSPKGQKGKLELAENGTIFLDEIGEISTEYQAKLLRVIQEREYYRVGGAKKLHTGARFIFATNQKIDEKLMNGSFRKDLYYRLNVGRIKISPLRERREEIIPLVELFLKQKRERGDTNIKKISPKAIQILENHTWPGNTRELKHFVERICFLFDGQEVQPELLNMLLREDPSYEENTNLMDDVREENFNLPDEKFDLKEFNSKIIQQTLKKFNNNKSKAAEYLGLTRYQVYNYINSN